MPGMLDIIGAANAGAGHRLDAAHFSLLDLIGIATATKNGGGQLTILNAGRLSALDRMGIANAGKTHVIFEL